MTTARQRSPLRTINDRTNYHGVIFERLECGHTITAAPRIKMPSKRRCEKCGEAEEFKRALAADRRVEQDDWNLQDALGIAYPKD